MSIKIYVDFLKKEVYFSDSSKLKIQEIKEA